MSSIYIYLVKEIKRKDSLFFDEQNSNNLYFKKGKSLRKLRDLR